MLVTYNTDHHWPLRPTPQMWVTMPVSLVVFGVDLKSNSLRFKLESGLTGTVRAIRCYRSVFGTVQYERWLYLDLQGVSCLEVP